MFFQIKPKSSIQNILQIKKICTVISTCSYIFSIFPLKKEFFFQVKYMIIITNRIKISNGTCKQISPPAMEELPDTEEKDLHHYTGDSSAHLLWFDLGTNSPEGHRTAGPQWPELVCLFRYIRDAEIILSREACFHT